MNLKEFLDNPVGKGDSSLNRTALRSLLDQKYSSMVKRKPGGIKSTAYHRLNSDEFYIHLIIPSETDRTNTYDVVFGFYPIKESSKSNSSILSTHSIRVFSNDPSFVYTFAKVYRDKDLFINQLSNKYPKEIFASNPEIRNRFSITNYNKYVYFGAKFIMDSRLLHRGILNISCVNYSDAVLQLRVRTLDRIMIDYKKAANKLKETKKENLIKKIDDVKSGKYRNGMGSSIVNVIDKRSSFINKKSSVTKMHKKK